MKKIAVLCLLAVGLHLSGCATNKETKSAHPQSLSAEGAEELAIGEQINATILSSFYPYTDPKVVEYINRVGYSLTEHAKLRHSKYRFTVLYSDKIYATSAPGGFVYLTTGMLYFVQNEAELAAVLAHEIAELQYLDPKLSNSRKVLDAVTRGGAMVGPAFGPIGLLTSVGLVAVNAVAQPHAMTLENRLILADKRGLRYMLDADQDPQGMIDLSYRFLRSKSEVVPYFYDYYQSRPISEERMLTLNQNFSKLPLQGKTFQTRREVYQDITQGIREIYKQ